MDLKLCTAERSGLSWVRLVVALNVARLGFVWLWRKTARLGFVWYFYAT
jgi:hypothetical protein